MRENGSEGGGKSLTILRDPQIYLQRNVGHDLEPSRGKQKKAPMKLFGPDFLGAI